MSARNPFVGIFHDDFVLIGALSAILAGQVKSGRRTTEGEVAVKLTADISRMSGARQRQFAAALEQHGIQG